MENSRGNQTEFYSPFAHIPGRYEWCRIHCPSHGSFDTFIVINAGRTDTAVTVYVNSNAGEAFMADRYPESRCIRLEAAQLTIEASPDGRTVRGRLSASEGPVREAKMHFESKPEAALKESAYGGGDFAVWGSRWSCTGVDMELEARVSGSLVREDGRDDISGNGILTLGSYGHIHLRENRQSTRS